MNDYKVQKYTSIRGEVQAIRVGRANFQELRTFTGGNVYNSCGLASATCHLKLKRSTYDQASAPEGSWIVQDQKGVFTVMTDYVFRLRHPLAESTAPAKPAVNTAALGAVRSAQEDLSELRREVTACRDEQEQLANRHDDEILALKSAGKETASKTALRYRARAVRADMAKLLNTLGNAEGSLARAADALRG